MKKGLCLLGTLVLLCVSAAAVSEAELKTAMEETAAYVAQTVQTAQVGSVGGDWAVLGLARSGAAVPEGYLDAVETYVEARGGVLHERKYTEYARVALALTAMGKDPGSVAGYDLLAPLEDHDAVCRQGINGPIWALLALDAAKRPAEVRQRYVDDILAAQLPDGGWSLTGSGAGDADLTAMALQALAKYQDQEQVQAATEKALTVLSLAQEDTGGCGSAESTAQVLVALCELGLDWEDERFTKNGRTVLDGLLTFRREDGAFSHDVGGTADQMTSEQGLYALAAAWRFAQGLPSLYRMEDAPAAPAQTLPSQLLLVRTGCALGLWTLLYWSRW